MPVREKEKESGLDVLTVAQLIDELKGKVGRSAIYSALAAGEIPSVRIGRRILIPRRRLEEWLEGQGP